VLFEAPEESNDEDEDGLGELVLVIDDIVCCFETVERVVTTEAALEEEEVDVLRLGMVVKGELEPESLKVPLPVWQLQEVIGSDSQQNPLFPQFITPASERELKIPPGISAEQYCGQPVEPQVWSVHEPRI